MNLINLGWKRGATVLVCIKHGFILAKKWPLGFNVSLCFGVFVSLECAKLMPEVVVVVSQAAESEGVVNNSSFNSSSLKFHLICFFNYTHYVQQLPRSSG